MGNWSDRAADRVAHSIRQNIALGDRWAALSYDTQQHLLATWALIVRETWKEAIKEEVA